MTKLVWKAADGNGREVGPGVATIPILQEVEDRTLEVVGTGFYLTRYGLLVTARHVFDSAIAEGRMSRPWFALHQYRDREILFRKILQVTCSTDIDIAIAQADNYKSKYPDDPLMNMHPSVRLSPIEPGERLCSYAYPENKTMCFQPGASVPTICGDYWTGQFLGIVRAGERPFMPFDHFETSVEVRSGASGGPVFDAAGCVVGINCRGWDFRGGEHEGAPLSSIVPIGSLLGIAVPMSGLPDPCWERERIPPARRGVALTVAELIQYGHAMIDGIRIGADAEPSVLA